MHLKYIESNIFETAWFARLRFCRAWPLNILHLFLWISCYILTNCDYLDKLDLLKFILKEEVCSPTSWVIQISCYCIDFSATFTERFGHPLPNPGKLIRYSMLHRVWEVCSAFLWKTRVVSRCPLSGVDFIFCFGIPLMIWCLYVTFSVTEYTVCKLPTDRTFHWPRSTRGCCTYRYIDCGDSCL